MTRHTHIRYPRFCISAVLLQYFDKHQQSNSSQILNSITCIQASSGLSRYVVQMIKLGTKEPVASLT